MRKLLLVLASLVGSVVASLLVPSVAHACSAPEPGWHSIHLESDVAGEIPADGAVAFAATRSHGGVEIDAQVRDEGGAAVAGNVEMVPLTGDFRADRWESCPPESFLTEHLLVWRGDEPLQVGSTYTFEVAAQRGLGGEPEVDEYDAVFTVTESDDVDFEAPELMDVEVAITTKNHGYECCECETCYGRCCEEDDGDHCWYVTEFDHPVLKGTIGGNEGVDDHQVLYRVLDREGEVVDEVWRSTEVERVVGASEVGDEEYCFSVQAIYLPTGEMKTSDEVCLEEPDDLEFVERDLDWSWPEALCDESAPQPEDVGTGAPDTGTTDSDDVGGEDGGEVDTGGAATDVGPADGDIGPADESDDGGGCSVAGGGSAPIFVVSMVLMVWWIVRRRDDVRSPRRRS